MTVTSDDFSGSTLSGSTLSGMDGYIQPVDLRWDERDPNLLSVHYKNDNDDVIFCYWVTENGLLEQEEMSFPHEARSFLALRAPYFIFSTLEGRVHRQPLRDFVGLEGCDDATRCALLDFSEELKK